MNFWRDILQYIMMVIRIFGRSEIFQQNIRVTEDAQSLGIQPEWLRNFTYQLNIKTRFLNMNLSRSTATEG